jgi:hypothetical protein
MSDQPPLRDRAIDAVAQALNAGRYWLPTEGQAIAVDTVLAVALAAVHDGLRHEADHHGRAAAESQNPDLAVGHLNLSAGFLAAAGHVHSMNRQPTA